MITEGETRSVVRLEVASEQETIALAVEIAALLKTGDVVTLAGDLGSGKTTFARAIIRALAEDPRLENSPRRHSL